MQISDSGLYCVVVGLGSKRRIRIGALGVIDFEVGVYLYIGSAKRGLGARVARHKKRVKPLRWHIDYLRRHCKWMGVTMYNGMTGECELVDKIKMLINGHVAVNSFGSSDCRCPGHLIETKLSAQRVLVMLDSLKAEYNNNSY